MLRHLSLPVGTRTDVGGFAILGVSFNPFAYSREKENDRAEWKQKAECTGAHSTCPGFADAERCDFPGWIQA